MLAMDPELSHTKPSRTRRDVIGRLLVPSILATAAHRHPSINISAGVLNLRPPTMEACNLAFVGICATIVLGVFL